MQQSLIHTHGHVLLLHAYVTHCTHACTCTHTHTRTHTRMHTHTHACTHTHTHTHAHTHTHTHAHTHTEEFLIEDAKAYTFLSNGYLPVPGINDVSEYEDTLEAMKIMGMSEEESSGEGMVHPFRS